MAALLRPSVAGAVFCGESGYAFPKVASNFRILYICCVWSAGNNLFHSCYLAEIVSVSYGFSHL